MMISEPKVAIVICNWNRKADVLKCIESVYQLNYQNFDLIVVDNASTDGSADAITAHFPNQFLIQNDENRGGSGGFNTGIRYALEQGGYEYIYLLDNDVVVHKDALSHLVRAMDHDPRLAIAGSKLCLMDEPDTIQEFGSFVDWENMELRVNKRFHPGEEQVTRDEGVDYVPACSLLARTEAVRKVGLLDEAYFLYFDDVDWACRMGLAGFRIKVVAHSKVWHRLGSIHKKTTMGTYYHNRNAGYFFNRFMPEDQWESGMRKWLGTSFRAIATCRVYGKEHTADILEHAVRDFVHQKMGRADHVRFMAPEPGTKIPLSDFAGKHVAIMESEHRAKITHVLKVREPRVRCEIWRAGESSDPDILLVPCRHVFGTENHPVKPDGPDRYLIDPYLNILPLNREGAEIRNAYNDIMRHLTEAKMNRYMELLCGVRGG